MKNKILAASVLVTTTIFWSCQNNKQTETSGAPAQEYVLPSSLSQQQQQTGSSPTSNSDQIKMQPVTTGGVTINPNSANVKLNPPHGQPGHRCDIAVGAPLDGSVPPTTNLQTNTQPQSINIQPSTQTTSNNGKLNPPHGQPGHRCDIAVGAPLDSKPISNVQPNNQTVTINSANDNASKTTTNGNSKLNPPHGQPGHRCDIAVGAPLDGSDSKKAAIQTTNPKSPLQYFPTVQKVDPNTSKETNVDAAKKDSTKN